MTPGKTISSPSLGVLFVCSWHVYSKWEKTGLEQNGDLLMTVISSHGDHIIKFVKGEVYASL